MSVQLSDEIGCIYYSAWAEACQVPLGILNKNAVKFKKMTLQGMKIMLK